MENQEAQTELLKAQAKKTEDERLAIPSAMALQGSNIDKNTQEIYNMRQDIQRMLSQSKLMDNQAVEASARTDLAGAQERLAKIEWNLKNGQIPLQEAQTSAVKIANQLKGLELPQARAYGEYWSSELGKKQPYAEGVEKMGDAAGSIIGGVIKKAIPRKSTTITERRGRTTTSTRTAND